MNAGPFDIAKIRGNWERNDPPPSEPPLVGRLAEVPAPKDVTGIATGLLSKAARLAYAAHPDHETDLEPFFAEARRLLERLDQPHETPEARDELRKALEAQLDDLEELLEVYDLATF